MVFTDVSGVSLLDATSFELPQTFPPFTSNKFVKQLLQTDFSLQQTQFFIYIKTKALTMVYNSICWYFTSQADLLAHKTTFWSRKPGDLPKHQVTLFPFILTEWNPQ